MPRRGVGGTGIDDGIVEKLPALVPKQVGKLARRRMAMIAAATSANWERVMSRAASSLRDRHGGSWPTRTSGRRKLTATMAKPAGKDASLPV